MNKVKWLSNNRHNQSANLQSFWNSKSFYSTFWFFTYGGFVLKNLEKGKKLVKESRLFYQSKFTEKTLKHFNIEAEMSKDIVVF